MGKGISNSEIQRFKEENYRGKAKHVEVKLLRAVMREPLSPQWQHKGSASHTRVGFLWDSQPGELHWGLAPCEDSVCECSSSRQSLSKEKVDGI